MMQEVRVRGYVVVTIAVVLLMTTLVVALQLKDAIEHP
jgi:hypothetical protein